MFKVVCTLTDKARSESLRKIVNKTEEKARKLTSCLYDRKLLMIMAVGFTTKNILNIHICTKTVVSFFLG